MGASAPIKSAAGCLLNESLCVDLGDSGLNWADLLHSDAVRHVDSSLHLYPGDAVETQSRHGHSHDGTLHSVPCVRHPHRSRCTAMLVGLGLTPHHIVISAQTANIQSATRKHTT